MNEQETSIENDTSRKERMRREINLGNIKERRVLYRKTKREVTE